MECIRRQDEPAATDKMKNRYKQVCAVLSAGLLIVMGTLFVMQFKELPERIPMHYNAAGEIDRYGSKWGLLLLPAIGTGMFVMFFLFSYFLKRWKCELIARKCGENEWKAAVLVENMLGTMELFVVALFFVIFYYQLSGKTLGAWFIWTAVLSLFAVIVGFTFFIFATKGDIENENEN